MTERVKIKCDDCKFVDDCVDYGWEECKKFTQKASEPQTNDEWRKTCSTEEFAEFLNFIAFDWNRVDEKWVMEWLKQPHTTIKE